MIPLIKKLDIDEINTSLIAIRKLLNNVGITETNITNVINNNNSGSGLPLGSWISFENDIAPNNNWIRAGTTFDATKYPALNLYLGGNTVPERYDHTRLSDFETIGSHTYLIDYACPYDGFIYVFRESGDGWYGSITRNGKTVQLKNYVTSGGNLSTCIYVKKGDVLTIQGNSSDVGEINARFYKHPLFIKATS